MEVRRYIEYIDTSPSQIISVAVIGVATGVLWAALTIILQKFLLEPVFCQVAITTYCKNVPTIGVTMSTIVVHIAGLAALARMGVLRPLLVVLAAVVTLVGLPFWVSNQPWWLELLYTGIITGLAYVYYAWVNRLAVFPVALVLTVVSVIVARLLLANW